MRFAWSCCSMAVLTAVWIHAAAAVGAVAPIAELPARASADARAPGGSLAAGASASQQAVRAVAGSSGAREEQRSSDAPGPGHEYFVIEVVDSQTGRGVPMVELETVNGVRYYTDSNGIAAVCEPGLVNHTVFFHVRSHGYEFPKDGFGMQGVRLKLVPGGKAQLKVHRLNIAERLYRVTGEGIYRDSVLLGHAAPVARPLLSGQVLGQDSVMTAVYRGKLYWFWGDTQQPGHPLGNFHVSGAVSELPGRGGLDPEHGVQLEYFVDQQGQSRPMAPMAGEGPTWIEALAVLPQPGGEDRLYAFYVKVRPSSLEIYRRGIAVLDEQQHRFQHLADWPMDSPIQPAGHTFKHTDNGVEYIYFAFPLPVVRVRADVAQFCRPEAYQAYTCLVPGTSCGDDRPAADRRSSVRIDRFDDGRVRWGWKNNTAMVGPQQQREFVKSGQLKAAEALVHLQDPQTGKPVLAHRGSVYWNAYRQRWVMIVCEQFGTSVLGEIWYAEADAPIGPWVYARKIVTHQKQSFYNPKQHPEFDKSSGRIIFFEGTYTNTFSGNAERTPRYDYNQMMYKLDLADQRLVLPVPVYRFADPDGAESLGTAARAATARRAEVAFFALDRPLPGCVAVAAAARNPNQLEVQPAAGADQQGSAQRQQSAAEPQRAVSSAGAAHVLFYALPADMPSPPPTTVPLFEYRSKDGMQRCYATTDRAPAGYVRADKPVCLVWRNPIGPGVLPDDLPRCVAGSPGPGQIAPHRP